MKTLWSKCDTEWLSRHRQGKWQKPNAMEDRWDTCNALKQTDTTKKSEYQ